MGESAAVAHGEDSVNELSRCSTTLPGTAAARGTHVGRARVLVGDVVTDLRDGDILVCRTMPRTFNGSVRVGAVVTDAGGVLSSPAIVARELGIPAVVATGMATSRIRDGQRLMVDGDRGVVTILSTDDAPASNPSSSSHG